MGIPEWEEIAIPEGFGPYRLLYNPISETVIAELRSIGEQSSPNQTYVRKKDSPRYESIHLGPNADKLSPKPTMTQNKARRTNEIDFLQLPWAQEVWGSNLHAPTTFSTIDGSRVSNFSLEHPKPVGV